MTEPSLTLEVVGGVPGSGKTRTAWLEASRKPGLYVFAFHSIELLEEQAAHALKTGPRIFTAHSDKAGNVEPQILRAVETIRRDGLTHAFLLITHRALIAYDLSVLWGWHWVIDEAPQLHANGKLKITSTDQAAWASLIELTNVAGGVSAVNWTAPPQSVGEAMNGLLAGQANFVTAAERGGVILFSETLTVGSHSWLSIWLPSALPAPKSVRIVSASFEKSISAKLLGLLAPETGFTYREIIRPRLGQPTVTIRYFADWEATTQHWKTREGRGDLKAMADHIRTVRPDLGFWSGNEDVLELMDHRVSDREGIPPKAMGLNRHDASVSCAFFYSAKAVPGDEILLAEMGLTNADILAAREDEDVFQFVYRGAIRRPEYAGPYDIYLFSRQQAERLKHALEASGLTNVQIERATVAGVSAEPVAAKKKGRPKRWVGETDEERKARLAAYARRRRAANKPLTD